MSSPYKVLALDLDGTLTNTEKNITQKTKEAVKRAIEYGISVVLASGRPMLGIENIAEELELAKLGGFIMGFNGGRIVDCKSKKIIFSKTIEPEYIKSICSLAFEYGLSVLTYTDTQIVSEDEDAQYVIKEAYNNSSSILSVKNLPSFVDYPTEKFMIVGDPQKISTALPKLQEFFKGKLNVFCSESYFIEVMPLDIEKAVSMMYLLDYLNFESRQLIACGDGLNDIPLLKLAGMGVAMENAYPQTKEISDMITRSNDEDGVAYAIEQLIFGKALPTVHG